MWRLPLMAAVLMFAAPAHSQTVYKYKAPDGSTVYSDRPPAGGHADKIIQFEDLPSSPVPDDLPLSQPDHSHRGANRGTSARARQPASNQAAQRDYGLTLYSATWCGYCRRAKAYLASHDIAYENVDIDTPYGRESFHEIGGGGIPLLVGSGGRRVRGYRQDGYDAFFAQ